MFFLNQKERNKRMIKNWRDREKWMRSYYFTFSAVNPFPPGQTSRITDSIDIVAACACADAFERTVLTIETIIAFCTKHKKWYVHFVTYSLNGHRMINHQPIHKEEETSYRKYKLIHLSSPQILLTRILYLNLVH